MEKKKKLIAFIIFFVLIAGLFVLTRIVPGGEEADIKIMMRDAVLHEVNQVEFLGMLINPGLVSAFTVSGVLIILAVILRIFVIPKFTLVPGKIQLILETIVGLFDNMAEENSPNRNKFLKVYMTVAGIYIFFGTLFELFGFQVISVSGMSVALPAPLADINGAITVGCLTYLVIMAGAVITNGVKGIGETLKDFSLPISMSFRLFGALLSGALVTELVYHFVATSYVLPSLIGVIFTLLHAVIQSYVLTMLVSIFYGQVTEHKAKKEKKNIKTEEI